MWKAQVLLVLAVTAEKQCENSGGTSECAQRVVHAMVEGFATHPEKFIGLTVHSTYSDFQAYFHNTGMHGCPRPCLPQEEPCVEFGPNYPGMTAVMWVRNDGMRNHPQWFPELSSESTNLEIAKVLYQHGNKETPRVCEKNEEEGHFVPAKQWDAKRHKRATQVAHVQKPFLHCGTDGISFSFLDFVGHMPVTKDSSYACRTHCDDQKATYFNFYAPTGTCHCPPLDAQIIDSLATGNVGGKVHCASTEYIKKLDATVMAPKVAGSQSPLPLLLLSAAVTMVALLAIAYSQKNRLKEVFGISLGQAEHERVLMLRASV